MKKLTYLMMIAFMAFSFYSCKEEDPPTPEVTAKITFADGQEDNKTVSSAKETVVVNFKSAKDWTVSIEETEAATWCSLTPEEGGEAGDANTITIVAVANDTHINRVATIVIVSDEVEEEFTLTQKQLNALIISGEPTESFPSIGGDFEITVSENMETPTVVIKEADKVWIKSEIILASKALEVTTFKITIEENTTPDERSSVITIKSGDKEEPFNVTQEGKIDPSKITANCFIVAPSRSVTIPINNVNIFWGKGGDGAIATLMGDTWSEPNLEAPAVTANLITDANYVAEVIWSDIAEGVNVSFDKTATRFTVSNLPATAGNIVVGVKKAGATGTDPYLWSWHLWVTDFNPATDAVTLPNGRVAMDRNLGATNATAGDVGALGLLYQWGRKDPFPNSSDINANTVRTTYPAALPATVIVASSLLDVVGKPNVYYRGPDIDNSDAVNKGHLNKGKGMNRWGGATSQTVLTAMKNTKSIYDPCPDGWRMPWGANWNGFTRNNLVILSDDWDTNPGGREYTDANSKKTWFPAAGSRLTSNGNLTYVGSYGYYWSGSPSGLTSSLPQGYNLFFHISYMYPSTNFYRTYGNSVRPVQE